MTVVSAELIKKYGDKAFNTGSQIIEAKGKLISVSPAIDLILGGGIPDGAFVIFTGDPKSGKTVTSLHFAGNAQKLGMKIFYLDIENRLKSRDLEGIKSIERPKDVIVVKSYREDEEKIKVFKANEWLDMAIALCEQERNSVIILDSVSQLMSAGEYDASVDQKFRAPISVLLSQFCKRVKDPITLNNNVIICIVHLIANTSGFGAAKGRSGGRKIQYAVDVDLEIKKTERWTVGGSAESGDKDDDSDDGKEQIGQKVMWITRSTAILAPGKKVTSYLRYGVGIDELTELVEIGKSLGLVRKKGAWYCLIGMANHLDKLGIEDWEKGGEQLCQAQGQEKFTLLLQEKPILQECLRNDVREMLG